MENKDLVDALNQMLEQEHACAIRYATHAAVVQGPYAEAVAARLKEIAADEIMHAEKLRDRIIALGGEPSMEVSRDDLTHAHELASILKVNMDEEKHAIEGYRNILSVIPQENVILFRAVQDILQDEQEHLEELEQLEEAH